MRKFKTLISCFAISCIAAILFYLWAPRTHALMPQAVLRTETGVLYLTGRAFVAKRWFFSQGCYFVMKTDATFEPSWFATNPLIGNATGIASRSAKPSTLLDDRVHFIAGPHLVAYEMTGRKIEHVRLPEVSDMLYGMSGGHHKIIVTEAGDRVIAARAAKDESGMILAVHRHGQILWSKKLPGGPYPDFASFQKTSDGGYLLLAEETSRASAEESSAMGARLIKISPAGDAIWDVALKAHSFQNLKSVAAVEDSDGSFVVLGRVIPQSSGGYANGHYVSLTRVSAEGQILQQTDLNDKRTDKTFPRTLLKNPDGNFAIVATSADGAVHLLHINRELRLTDLKTLPLTEKWDVADAVTTPEGRIILTGAVSQREDFEGSLNSGIGILETDGDARVHKMKTLRHEDLTEFDSENACASYGIIDALFGK